MYDKEYANVWLKFRPHDILRKDYILPFLDEQLKDTESLIDVGCGWGEALYCIPVNCKYLGVDPTTEFFKTIQKEHGIDNLIEGQLPNLPVNEKYDTALCSMVLHCTPHLEKSIEELFRVGKRVIIIDFNNQAEDRLRKRYNTLDVDEENYLKGVYNLNDEIQIYGEVYLHKEEQFKKILSKFGITKEYNLGPLFKGFVTK